MIRRDASGFTASYVNPGGCADGNTCPLHSAPSHYIQVILKGNEFKSGKMIRCTHLQKLRDHGLGVWEANIISLSITQKTINGRYKGEHWTWDDEKDGRRRTKKGNQRWR